jgi:hypothetical protein
MRNVTLAMSKSSIVCAKACKNTCLRVCVFVFVCVCVCEGNKIKIYDYSYQLILINRHCTILEAKVFHIDVISAYRYISKVFCTMQLLLFI